MLADSHTGLTVNGDFGSNSDPNSVSIQYSTPNVLGHVPMIYAQNVAGVTTALKLVWQIIEAVISIPNGTPGISAVQNFPAAFPAGFSYIIGFINQRNPLGNANLNSPCFVPVSGSQYQVSLANAGAATNTTLDILAMAGYA
jgi:hypothetical protein